MYGNPILNQIGSPRSNNSNQSSQLPTQQVKNLMRQIQTSSNSQLALQQMIAKNSGLIDLIRLSKGNLKQAAEYIAKQKGYDLNALIQDLQS